MVTRKLTLALALAFSGGLTQASASRDYISIVGSSTVYPFATVVAEAFGRRGSFKTPKIESTGTGGGLKLFCAGIGVEHPDVSNASRRIKPSEVDDCAKHGVNDIVEMKIGYDGIVVANSKATIPMELTRKDLFLALAKDIPDPKNPESGQTIANPHKTWKDVNPALPNAKIEVLGPPPTSGTRDAFVELVMEAACKSWKVFHDLEKTDKNRFKQVCHTIREDGAYIEAGENDNLIVQKLGANPATLGIFGYSFLDQNRDKIVGSKIEGIEPTFEAIASGAYKVSRPLYFYVKKAHIGTIPGIAEYIAEFMSEKALGDEGYLADKGLIPMPADERVKFIGEAKALPQLKL